MGEAADPTARLRESWEANAAAWTRVVREREIESRRVGTDDAIVGAVLDRSPRCVLDVGCGEGWLCRALSARGVDAVGVDGSAPLVESARASGGARFELLSYDDLVSRPERLGRGRFDVVVCNFALLQEDLAPLLGALRALLSSDGVLLIQTVHPWSARGEGPYVDGWRTERFAGFGAEFPEPMPWYFRTLASWVESLREGGFRIDELREPKHPDTGSPLSLLLVAAPAER